MCSLGVDGNIRSLDGCVLFFHVATCNVVYTLVFPLFLHDAFSFLFFSFVGSFYKSFFFFFLSVGL